MFERCGCIQKPLGDAQSNGRQDTGKIHTGHSLKFDCYSIPHFIIYPCYPKFTGGVLFERQVFVVYAELSKVKNSSEKGSVHCFG